MNKRRRYKAKRRRALIRSLIPGFRITNIKVRYVFGATLLDLRYGGVQNGEDIP